MTRDREKVVDLAVQCAAARTLRYFENHHTARVMFLRHLLDGDHSSQALDRFCLSVKGWWNEHREALGPMSERPRV